MNSGQWSADQTGQARLPLLFGLANVVQSVTDHNLSIEASNSLNDMVHTLASTVLHTSLFTTMECFNITRKN